MATISKLAAFLTMDTSSFDRGITRSGQKAQTFGQMMDVKFNAWLGRAALSLAAVTAASFGLHAIFNKLSQTSEGLDRLGKIIQRFGVDAKAFRTLSVAAAESGIDLEALAKALNFMSKTVGSGGVSLDKRFAQMAKEIMAIKDPAERVARALEVFGKSGAELLPLFEDIEGGNLEKVAHIIDRFGLAISGEQLQHVDRMNDAFGRLTFIWNAFWEKFIVSIAPGVTIVLEEIVNMLDMFGDSQQTIEGRWETFELAATGAGIKVAEAMHLAGASVETMTASIDASIARWDFFKATLTGNKGMKIQAAVDFENAMVRGQMALTEMEKVLSGEFGRDLFIKSQGGGPDPFHKLRTAFGAQQPIEPTTAIGAHERGSAEAFKASLDAQKPTLEQIQIATAASATALKTIASVLTLKTSPLLPLAGGA